jgi:hypothetical protein
MTAFFNLDRLGVLARRSVLRFAPAVGEVGVDVEEVEGAADRVVDEVDLGLM